MRKVLLARAEELRGRRWGERSLSVRGSAAEPPNAPEAAGRSGTRAEAPRPGTRRKGTFTGLKVDTRGRTATTSYSPPLSFRDPSRRQKQTPALGSVLPSAPPPEHPSCLRPTDRALPPQLRHPDSPPVPARERQEHPRPCAPGLFPSQRRRRPSVPAPPESAREHLQPETPGSGREQPASPRTRRTPQGPVWSRVARALKLTL